MTARDTPGVRRAWGWVAHLRSGGTTPWRDWAEDGDPHGRILPGAQQLELLRRLNETGTGLPGARHPRPRGQRTRARPSGLRARRRRTAAGVRPGAGRPRGPARRRAAPSGRRPAGRGRQRGRAARAARPADDPLVAAQPLPAGGRPGARRPDAGRPDPARPPARRPRCDRPRGRHRSRHDAHPRLDGAQPRGRRSRLARVAGPAGPARHRAAPRRHRPHGQGLERPGRRGPGADRARPDRGARPGRRPPAARHRAGRSPPTASTWPAGSGRSLGLLAVPGGAVRCSARRCCPGSPRFRVPRWCCRPSTPTGCANKRSACAMPCSRLATLSTATRTACCPSIAPAYRNPRTPESWRWHCASCWKRRSREQTRPPARRHPEDRDVVPPGRAVPEPAHPRRRPGSSTPRTGSTRTSSPPST